MNRQSLLIKIDNYGHLAQSYGAQFASTVEQEIWSRLREVCGQVGVLTRLGAGRFSIGCASSFEQPLADLVKHWSAYVEELLAGFCGATGVASLAVLSVEEGGAIRAVPDASPLDDTWDQSQALEDMDAAALTYQAIADDRLLLAFQPIYGVDGFNDVLYQECLVRLKLDDGKGVSFPGTFIPSLERLGLMRCLDRHVTRRVIDVLKRFPELSLGVNISAQSAVDDVWWASTFADLSEEPDIASRLVFEITETARLRAGKGRPFVQRLRELGCRVAIDDFGVGYGVETGMEIGKPDVIKIDRSLLTQSDRDASTPECLVSMVSIAKDLAPHIVVEGVETASALKVVRNAGAQWAQGHYFGSPDALLLGGYPSTWCGLSVQGWTTDSR